MPPRAAVRLQKTEAKHDQSTYEKYAQARSETGPALKNGDPDFLQAAKEAAEGAGLDQFSASEIVGAFQDWKQSLGRSYTSKDDEASDLRAFGSNLDLITAQCAALQLEQTSGYQQRLSD